jgi:hypothetical protein
MMSFGFLDEFKYDEINMTKSPSNTFTLHHQIEIWQKKKALGGLIINKGNNHMNANWCQEYFSELLVVWTLGLKSNEEMG